MSGVTNELLQAVITATPEQKSRALEALRGNPPPTEGRAEVKGPLVMGMSAAAKYLGVSRPTMWRMVKAGGLRKVEIYPGAYRVCRADLDRIAGRYERRKNKGDAR